jgi:hypothetical protein
MRVLVSSGDLASSRLKEVDNLLALSGHSIVRGAPAAWQSPPDAAVVVSPVGEGPSAYLENWCRKKGVPMVLVARSMMEAIIEMDAWDAVSWTNEGVLRGLKKAVAQGRSSCASRS